MASLSRVAAHDKPLRQYLIFGRVVGYRRAVRGGTFAILVLEFYDDFLELVWRYSPALGNFAAVFHEELASEIIPPGPWEDEPYNLEFRVGGRAVLESLTLSDDVGTSYEMFLNSTEGGNVWDVTGRAMFRPSIRPAARLLVVSVLGTEFPIVLRNW